MCIIYMYHMCRISAALHYQKNLVFQSCAALPRRYFVSAALHYQKKNVSAALHYQKKTICAALPKKTQRCAALPEEEISSALRTFDLSRVLVLIAERVSIQIYYPFSRMHPLRLWEKSSVDAFFLSDT